MKKVNRIVLIIFFLLLISTNVHAIDNFNISATLGFDGKVKVGYLNPLKINIKSSNKGFDGNLAIETETRQYTEHINIQENTEVDFQLTMLLSQKDTEVQISLEEDEKIISTRTFPIEKLRKNTLLIGVLSDEPEKLNYLRESTIKALSEVNFETFDLRKHLEISHNELEAIDYIILENYMTEVLPIVFTDNLENWISEGHSVFIETDKYAHKTLTGIFEGLDDHQTIKYGYGNIVPFVADVESEYMLETLEKYSTYLNYIGLDDTKNILNEIDNSKVLFTLEDLILKPEYSYIYFFLSLIIIYIILVCIYTEKENRKIFGIIILCFSTIFFLSSFLISTVDSSIGQIGIDEYCEGHNSYNLTYMKSKNKTNASLKGNYIDNYNEEYSEISPIAKTISTAKEGEYHIYSKSFEDTDDTGLSINIDENDILTGEIENPLSSKLDKSFLIVGDTIINIGTLKGKEKVNIEYKLDYNLKNEGDFNYLNQVYNLNDLNDGQRQLFEYYYFNIENTAYNCKLIGFSTEKDEISINGKTKKMKRYTMNTFDFKIKGEDLANIPLGIIKPIAFYSGVLDDEIKRECNIEENQELIVIYPLPTDIDVEDIGVNIKVEFGNPELYVLNRVTNSWEPLTSEVFQGELLNKYISNGPLTIKVVGSSRITIPQISVKGRYK